MKDKIAIIATISALSLMTYFSGEEMRGMGIGGLIVIGLLIIYRKR